MVARRRLHGGLMSRVDELRVEHRDGARRSYVARVTDGDLDAGPREAVLLEAVAHVGLPTPRVVAAKGPTLLMTKLPGRVDLTPVDMEQWLRAMATPLPVLHAAASLRRVGTAWRAQAREFPWVRDAGLRRTAEALLATPPKRFACVPTHGDYQHFNLLWSRGRLSGIVDWSVITLGPPEIDVSHCRLNLAVLYSVEAAERFRIAYESEAGRAVDPWFDVHRVANFNRGWPGFIPRQVNGRAPLPRGMTGRVEALLRKALDRT